MTKTSLKNYLSFFLLGIILNFNCHAQEIEGMIYDDHIYRESIKTPIIYPNGLILSEPYIELNGSRLTIRFDDLDADYKDLYYSVVHCDANWNPSDLDQGDYIDGFYSSSIEEYEQSFNTLVPYTHYSFEFPNDLTRLRISGNYILYVYEDEDVENLVLSRRFVVFEQRVDIQSRIKESTKIADLRYNQEVDVTVFHSDFEIMDPYDNFKMSILQNGRWDNAKMDLRPRFVKNNELNFDYGDENVFKGGNEYRAFDIKDLGYVTSQVKENGIIDRNWNSWLMPDQRRAFKVYRTDFDLNGNFFIRNDDGFESHLEEEYVWVHFALPFEVDLLDNGVYIFGSLSDFKYKEEFRMNYSKEKKVYLKSVLLKQGYYNYQYLTKRETDPKGDPESIEGSHFQTENNYTVICYYTDFVDGYDRVIGLDNFNNVKN